MLHVISNFSSSYAGMAIACKEFAESQARIGLEVTLVTSNLDHPTGIIDKPLSVPVIENKVKVIYCPVQIRSIVFSLNLYNILKKEIVKASIVHIHGLYRFPQSFASIYARIVKKPYVLSPHGSLNPRIFNKKERFIPRKIYQKIIDNNTITLSTKIHFTAEDEKSNASFIVPERKGVVIPNGINSVD